MMSYQILPEVRREVEKRMLEALESDNPDESLPAANAQLLHRLRNSLQRIDDKREMDLQYLTCAEYQLFLDDMRAAGRPCEPDHWVTHHFARGSSLEPVTGVRPEDAEAYCQWLTQKHGGPGVRYRLPRQSEARDLPISKEMMGYWCRDSGQFHLIGLAREDESRIRSRFSELFGSSLSPISLLDINRNREVSLASEPENWGRRVFGAMFIASFITLVFILCLFNPEIALLAAVGVIGFVVGSAIVGVCLWLIGATIRALVSLMIRGNERDYPEPLTAGFGLIVGLGAGLLLLLIVAAWSPFLLFLLTLPSLIYLVVRRLPSVTGAIFSFPSKVRTGLYQILDLFRGFVFRSRNRRAAARKSAEALIDSRGVNSDERLEQRKAAVLELGAISISPETTDHSDSDQHRFLTDVHWWLQTVIAREEERLPAWEGIRVVREFTN